MFPCLQRNVNNIILLTLSSGLQVSCLQYFFGRKSAWPDW